MNWPLKGKYQFQKLPKFATYFATDLKRKP